MSKKGCFFSKKPFKYIFLKKLFISINFSNKYITYGGSTNETAADLCREHSNKPDSTCPSLGKPGFNSTSSTFYTMVHSYEGHGSGTLTFTGSNLLSVHSGQTKGIRECSGWNLSDKTL